MEFLRNNDFGWQRDLPDRRDFTSRHPAVRRLLRTLRKRKGREGVLPDRVDSREYCPPIQDQQPLAASTAHAGTALVQYFERRAHGRVILPSRLFLYKNSRRLMHRKGDQGATLRGTLKALVRFGMPPESHWPYDPRQVDGEPDAFHYAFAQETSSVVYLRIDERGQSGESTLESVKAYIAAGFLCVLGFPVYGSISDEAEIAYPTPFDSVHSGHAVVVVGYNDQLRIRSDKGALLIRNSWGIGWGDQGYGWLPYTYVREKLAVDVWTLLKPEWLDSGEFDRPLL